MDAGQIILEGGAQAPQADFRPSIPNFVTQKELKTKDKGNIYLAKNLDKSTLETRKKLAHDMARVNRDLKVKAAIDQMAINAYDLYYLTVQDGTMVGYATVFPEDVDEGSCHLNKIHTADTHKNKGVATTILEQIMSDYKKISLDDANTGEDGSKEGMINLYKRLGFDPRGNDRYEWTKAK